MQNVVGYIRVSTGKQEASGLGMDAQRSYIETAAKQQGWNIVAIFSETVSGSVAPQDRPEMAKALAVAKQHDAHILAAKIDRISRDVEHMAGLMKRASLKVATMPQADNFQLHLFAALAEQERQFISQRTKEALQALKDRAEGGCTESQAKIDRRSNASRKNIGNDAVVAANTARKAASDAHAATLEATIALGKAKGHTSLRELAAFLNERSVSTPRGGLWSAVQVSRVMQRIEATC